MRDCKQKMKLMFEVFADIHMSEERNQNNRRECFIAALSDIKKNFPDTDAILSAGDFTASGKKEQFEHFYEILEEHSPVDKEKWLLALGNHDVRGDDPAKWNTDPEKISPTWEAAKKWYLKWNAPYMNEETQVYYDKWIKGYHFIVLNTENGLKDACSLSESQLVFLEEKLSEKEDGEKPIFVMIHQPLWDTHWRGNILKGFGEEDHKVKEILARHPQVVFFSGHIHNGVGVTEIIERPFGTMVDLPSFLFSENGVTEPGIGYHVEVYEDCITMRARNYEKSMWIPQYDRTWRLPSYPVLWKNHWNKGDVDENVKKAEEHVKKLLNRCYDQKVIKAWDDVRAPKQALFGGEYKKEMARAFAALYHKKTLWDPVMIGNMQCPNRFLRSATWENMSDEKGHMTERQYEVYRELAQNQVGLISTGYARIMEEEYPNPGMMGIYDDTFLDEYKKLTDMVHQYGSKIMMQIAYGGTKTTYRLGERIIFAPGDVAEKSTGNLGKPMTKEEIQLVIRANAKAAARVKRSGFDAVQLHAAHSYLVNQFLSPYYNNRNDEYGQSLENRMRIVREMYEEVRKEVGNDFPILIKVTCSDFFEEGLHFSEVKQICKELEELGFDGIEISGNIHGKAEKMIGETWDGHVLLEGGYFLEYAREIADECHIPIYVTGGCKDPIQLEEWLNTTHLSGFGISRPLLAEPDLIRRWMEGDWKEAKCLHCSKCRTKDGNYCVVFQSKKKE